MEFDKGVVKEGYDSMAQAYLQQAQEDSDGVRARYTETLLSLLREHPPEGSVAGQLCVLDIGCGPGIPAGVILTAAGANVIGVDISASQVALAQEHVPQGRFECADIMDFQVEDSSLDGVLALFSVFHLPRHEQSELFMRIQKWLRPGGVFLFNVGDHDGCEMSHSDDFLGSRMLWSSWDLEGNITALKNAKLVVEKSEDFIVNSGNSLDKEGQTFTFFVTRREFSDVSEQKGGGPVIAPEHVRVNQAHWDGMADQWVTDGERKWDVSATATPIWGIWSTPEAELRLLPEDMHGMDAIELGCGTAYLSAWMARRGARVYGIDNSIEQLGTARRLALAHGADLDITLEHGDAQAVPRLDGSFDFAISEYGAAIWCDPYVWIREAHRLLRPKGTLVFMGHSPWACVCTPQTGNVGERLCSSYFDLHRQDWSKCEVDPGGVEFNLPISSWMRLFRDVGFDIMDFQEVRAPEGVEEVRFGLPAEWARQFPSEQVWTLRKL